MSVDIKSPTQEFGRLPTSTEPAIHRVLPQASEIHEPPTLQFRQEQALARFLGWFSVGLGVTEILAPRELARAIGVRDNYGFLPTAGIRELAGGIGILAQRRPTGFLWARVAGDMMDLAFLASNYMSRGTDKQRIAISMAAVAGVTLLDLIAAERHSEHPKALSQAPPKGNSIYVYKAVTVNKSREELYQFWHNFENFPRFMRHLKSVHALDEKTSRWEAYAPLGGTVSWDAEMTEDVPNQRIAWRAVDGSTIPNTGLVEFQSAPGNRGTEVRVELSYNPPGGAFGATLANLLGEDPEFQVQEDLRHLKQFLETGEIPTTEGQPTGRGGRTWLSGF
jgi:uncharacterized membrane protein